MRIRLLRFCVFILVHTTVLGCQRPSSADSVVNDALRLAQQLSIAIIDFSRDVDDVNHALTLFQYRIFLFARPWATTAVDSSGIFSDQYQEFNKYGQDLAQYARCACKSILEFPETFHGRINIIYSDDEPVEYITKDAQEQFAAAQTVSALTSAYETTIKKLRDYAWRPDWPLTGDRSAGQLIDNFYFQRLGLLVAQLFAPARVPALSLA